MEECTHSVSFALLTAVSNPFSWASITNRFNCAATNGSGPLSLGLRVDHY